MSISADSGGLPEQPSTLTGNPSAMTHTIDTVALPAMSPGTTYQLTIHRFGNPGARPKAYFQAALHADETPGLLVGHHLLRALIDADAEGRIVGEIVLVPVANPIGLSQNLEGYHVGRLNLDGGGNFNRGFPDLASLVEDDVAEKLGAEAEANVSAIRTALKSAVDGLDATTAHQALRRTLLAEAVDADIVLDLHCDLEALMHIYLGTPLWPDAADLCAELGLRAVLLADDSGGGPFDEACGNPWWRLAEKFPDYPIPPACLAGTVEYRGQAEVSDALALADAEALVRFLTRRGVIEGDAPAIPNALCDGTPLEGTEIVYAPCAGVAAYAVELGDIVAKGDLIAEIVDPSAHAPASARTPISCCVPKSFSLSASAWSLLAL